MMNSPRCAEVHRLAAWGAETRDGHLLGGRNFDWEPAPIFDEERVADFL